MNDDDLIKRGAVLDRIKMLEHGAEERNWRSGANELARLRRYVAALASVHAPAQPVAVKVKPLVWSEDIHGVWTAKTGFGEYSVGFDDGWWSMLEGPSCWEWVAQKDPRSYQGPYAGMAAAQADYEARILAALDVQPITVQDAARVPEVKALIEAMDFALIRWDEHYEHGYNMQGDWVSDARAALRAIAGGDA